MRFTHLTALMLLAAVPALAQPIIVPLETQPKQVTPPVASAPPVAPPIAEPSSAQNSGQTRRARASSTTQGEASQPAARGK